MTVRSGAAPVPHSRIILILMILQIIPYGFGFSTFFILTPDMQTTFGWSYTRLGVINAASNIALLTMSYGAIWTTIRLGVRRAMTLSMLFSTLIFLCLFVNRSATLAMVLVVLLVAAAPIAWIPIVPFITMTLPEARRGSAMSVVCSGPPVAMVTVALSAPLIIRTAGWPWVWGLVGVLCVLILAVCLPLLFRIPIHEEKRQRDRVKLPVKLTLMCCAMTFANGLGDMPVLTFMGTVLRDGAGLSVAEAGRGWFFCGMGGILSGPFLGAVLNRLGSARQTMIYLLPMLGMTTMVFVLTRNSWLLYPACFSLGLHHMAVYGIHGAYLSRTMGLIQSTKAFGLVSLSYGLGSVLGNYLVGAWRDLAGNFFMVFSFLALVLVMAAGLSWLLPRDDIRAVGKVG